MNEEPVIDPVELCNQSMTFLEKILDVTSKFEPPHIRQTFVHQNAVNIFQLAKDVKWLEDQGRTNSPPILIRAMLEHLLNLVAASIEEGFAEKKMIYDFDQDQKHTSDYEEWKKESGKPVDSNNTSKKIAEDLRLKCGLKAGEKIKRLGPKECAEKAGLESTYHNEYATYCLNTHASILAFFGKVFGIGSAQRSRTIIFILLKASEFTLKAIPTKDHNSLMADCFKLQKQFKGLAKEFIRLYIEEFTDQKPDFLVGSQTKWREAN